MGTSPKDICTDKTELMVGAGVCYSMSRTVYTVSKCNGRVLMTWKLTLSPQMSFTMIGIYRPPSASNVFV